MSQRNTYLKSLIWFSVIFAAVVFVIIGIALRPAAQRADDLSALPEQTAQVEVVRLSSYRSRRTAVFLFPGGTERSFRVGSSVYAGLFKHETGILTYKEIPGSQEKRLLDYRLFINFEKELDLSQTEENIQAKKTSDITHVLIWFVFIPPFILFMSFGRPLIDKRKIRVFIKASGGKALSIKLIKPGSLYMPVSSRRKRPYLRYKVIYQLDGKKIECIADFDQNAGGRKTPVRLFTQTTLKDR